MSTLTGVVTKFYEEYNVNTPKKLKIIDAYLTYIFFTGVVQFVYCCLVGTFPFNAFLSGFISSVASFVLAVCLRLQVRTLYFLKRYNFQFIFLGKPCQQIPVCWNQSRESFCRLHLRPRDPPSDRDELYRLNCFISSSFNLMWFIVIYGILFKHFFKFN